MGEKSAHKKQFIVETARQVFVEKGYKDVTMKDIVDACGISRGGLYLYFESTAELFREVLEAEQKEKDDTFSFRLTDPFLPENSGIYTVTAKKGQLHIEKEDRAENKTPDFTVGAGALNQLFFGALSVRESEKLGGLKWQGEKEKNEKEEIIHRLLPPMKNWINEWY